MKTNYPECLISNSAVWLARILIRLVSMLAFKISTKAKKVEGNAVVQITRLYIPPTIDVSFRQEISRM